MSNNTEVNTDVVGNTNTTTSNITEQIKYINQNYFCRPDIPLPRITTLNVIRDSPIKKEKTDPKQLDYSGYKSRSWLLTINNFKDTDIITIKSEKTVYKVWQFEVGKKGTKHLHCVLYFKNARSWPKKRYPTARIEIPRNLNDCINYCMKEKTRVDGPWEEGERPCQGRRKDLEEIAASLKDGNSLESIAIENPSHFIRYHRGLKTYKETLLKPRNWRKKAKVS